VADGVGGQVLERDGDGGQRARVADQQVRRGGRVRRPRATRAGQRDGVARLRPRRPRRRHTLVAVHHEVERDLVAVGVVRAHRVGAQPRLVVGGERRPDGVEVEAALGIGRAVDAGGQHDDLHVGVGVRRRLERRQVADHDAHERRRQLLGAQDDADVRRGTAARGVGHETSGW